MAQPHGNLGGRRNRRSARARTCLWLTLLVGAFSLMMATITALVVVPIVSPAVGADLADILRSIFGPEPVAVLESISFQLQDEFNQLRSELNGGQVQITLSNQSQGFIEPTSTYLFSPSPPLTPFLPAIPKSTGIPPPPASTPTVVQNTPLPSYAIVLDPPQIGWEAYGPSVNGQPALARAMILVDPKRSYAGVALVRIDLSKLQLHMMPGYLEPSHPAELVQVIPNPGMVPSGDQAKLIAAFNGGFKHIHGRYGMMVAGLTLVAPKSGLATIAIYQDGHLQIGTWDQDMTVSPDMIAFRQNCPPLIENGKLSPMLSGKARKVWGFSDNGDITWRTGLGLTQDARYLIYAVGNGTSVETLAKALQQAGSYNAMQLDIHQFYVHFLTYQPSDPAASNGFSLTGLSLLDQMIYNPHLYLAPDPRDFFYLTIR